MDYIYKLSIERCEMLLDKKKLASIQNYPISSDDFLDVYNTKKTWKLIWNISVYTVWLKWTLKSPFYRVNCQLKTACQNVNIQQNWHDRKAQHKQTLISMHKPIFNRKLLPFDYLVDT